MKVIEVDDDTCYAFNVVIDHIEGNGTNAAVLGIPMPDKDGMRHVYVALLSDEDIKRALADEVSH